MRPQILAALDDTVHGARSHAIEVAAAQIRTCDDVDMALAIWADVEAPSGRETTLQAIVKAWAAFDPRGAGDWVLAQSRSSLAVNRMRQALLYVVVREWARTDPVSAIECTDRLVSVSGRAALIYQAMDVWAGDDPETAARAVDALGLERGAARTVWRNVLQAWAKQSAIDAIAFLDSLPDDHEAQDFRADILYLMGKTDPGRAALLAATLDGRDRQRILGRTLQQWSVSDPSAASDFMEKHLEELGEDVLPDLAASLAKVDVPKALAAVGRIKDLTAADAAFRRVLTTWGRTDPEAALAYLDGLPADHQAQAMRAALLPGLAATDREGALRRAEQIPDDKARRAALSTLLRTWAAEDFDSAMAYLEQRPGDDHAAVRAQLIQGLAWRDHERAFEMCKTVTDEDSKRQIMQQIMTSWSLKDPLGAVDALMAMKSESWADSVKAQLARNLSASDPNLAIKVVSSITTESLRDGAIQQVVWAWSRHAPMDALACLDTLPQSDQVNLTRARVLQTVAEIDFDAAIEAAEAIPSGDARDSSIAALAKQWARIEPEAAIAWYLNQSSNAEGVAVGLRGLLETWAWQQEDGDARSAEWIVAQGTDLPADILSVMVERLARTNVEAALSMAAALPDTEEGNAARKTAYEMVIREIATIDGPRAAEMVRVAGDFQFDSTVVAEVVFSWAGQDPTSAAAWVETFPAGREERSQGITDVYEQWLQQDADAARTWYRRMNPGAKNARPDSRGEVIYNP